MFARRTAFALVALIAVALGAILSADDKDDKTTKVTGTAIVPKDVPSTVVYPFAGGDLSTALTVFPDAYDITRMSLEPAGDATALSHIARRLRVSLASLLRGM